MYATLIKYCATMECRQIKSLHWCLMTLLIAQSTVETKLILFNSKNWIFIHLYAFFFPKKSYQRCNNKFTWWGKCLWRSSYWLCWESKLVQHFFKCESSHVFIYILLLNFNLRMWHLKLFLKWFLVMKKDWKALDLEEFWQGIHSLLSHMLKIQL